MQNGKPEVSKRTGKKRPAEKVLIQKKAEIQVKKILKMADALNEKKIEKILEKTTGYEDSGEYEKAIRLYDSLLRCFPDNPRYWALRGYCNYHRKAYSEALRDFTQALSLQENAATTWFYRARTYEKFDRLDEALADYQKSAEQLPKYDVFLNMGLIHEYREEFESAKKYYSMALKLEPENESVKNGIKRIRKKMKCNGDREKIREIDLYED